MAESYWLSFKTPVTIVRPFNTYGPRQSMRAIIPTIIAQALTKKKLTLGSLYPVRDLTFIKDTALGFIAAANSEKALGATVNLGVGEGTSIEEIVNRISNLLGIDLPVCQDQARVRPASSEVMRLISNNSKAKLLMDWQPTVNLDDGLSRTIEFIQNNLSRFKGNSYAV